MPSLTGLSLRKPSNVWGYICMNCMSSCLCGKVCRVPKSPASHAELDRFAIEETMKCIGLHLYAQHLILPTWQNVPKSPTSHDEFDRFVVEETMKCLGLHLLLKCIGFMESSYASGTINDFKAWRVCFPRE